jgi:hypothetical protein
VAGTWRKRKVWKARNQKKRKESVGAKRLLKRKVLGAKKVKEMLTL